MHRRNGLSLLLLATAITALAGCSSTAPSARIAQPLDIAGADQGAIVDAAQRVLSRMYFSVEKADREAGIVRTKPLAGAQVFEFWRSDNTTLRDALQSNIHSIRRSVEITVDPARDPAVECIVHVQRLSLPGQEVASVSQAYLIHSRSEPDLQTLVLTPRQRAEMAWIDLDNDEVLAAEILRRIGSVLEKQKAEEAS